MTVGRFRLCGVEDLAVGESRSFEVDGVAVCLVRCRDRYRAIGDVCSHERWSLADGEVDLELCEIECSKHGSTFSLESGEPMTLPASQPVAVFSIEIEDGQVWVAQQ
jgi:3-phenylpropionate/trans-cinnamate dioxygenase ferredoxin subunit